MIKLLKGVNSETIALERQQPNCQFQSVDYNLLYTGFLPKVSKTMAVVHYCKKQFEHTLYKKEKIDKLYQTIEKLATARNMYHASLTQSSRRFTEEVLFKLKSLEREVENSQSDIIEIQQVESRINDFEDRLNMLLQPTHQWELISDENKKRCTKCLAIESFEEKKPQPTIYDEESKEYPHYW